MTATIAATDAAWRLARDGELANALRLCQSILVDDPGQAEAWHLIGLMALSTGEVERALRTLARSVEIASDNAVYQGSLGAAMRVAGDPQQARIHLEKAIALDPTAIEPRTNLGGLLLAENKWHEARSQFEKVLDVAPCVIEAVNNLGVILIAEGDADAAMARYDAALKGTSDTRPLLIGLAGVHIARGHHDEALDLFLRILKDDPNSRRARDGIVFCIKSLGNAATRPALEEALPGLLNASDVDPQALVGVALGVLRQRAAIVDALERARSADEAGFAESFRHGLFDAAMLDPLLQALLRRTVLPDAGFERLLTRLRACFLRTYAETPAPSGIIPFMASIAQQCFLTEYVHATDADEDALVDDVWAATDAALAESDGPCAHCITGLVLGAAYRSPHLFSGWHRALDWPEDVWPQDVRLLIAQTVRAPLALREIAKTIPAFGDIVDAVSVDVAAQYEENPYPRWSELPPRGGSNLIDYFRQCLPHVTPPDFLTAPMRLLVAGCGTGRDALSMARLFKESSVTAIDLSRASLAYGSGKAKEFGFANISFHHGDLLNVSALGGRFDIISSSGVLHHMQEPARGLKALTDVLAPGGLMLIALYSRIARNAITRARQQIAEGALGRDASSIRRFRQDILARDEEDVLHGLTHTTDFYYLSGTRDLIFHVQEHQFDLPEIGSLLRDAGLEFLGIQISDARIAQAYRAEYPGDPTMTDLDLWHRFEQRHPNTFAGMIHVWCRKPTT